MGKRILALILVLVMSISVIACANEEPVNEKNNEAPVQSADTAADKSEPEAAPAVTETPEPVYDGKNGVFDTEITYQTIDGFGAAYTWYGDRLMNCKDPEGAYAALFDEAKFSILRFKNEYEYSIEDKAGNATAMARNYKEARDRAALRGEKVQVLLCCWSPPAKLKSDSSIDTGKGTLKRNENGGYCYEEYADWWVESVQYYQSKGIVIDYVSIQNEIDFGPDDYEGCLFSPNETTSQASYAKAFIAVYKAFKEAFGDNAPKLLGPETMGCNSGSLLSYINPIIKECPESLDGLAFHLYATGTSSSDDNTVKPSSYYQAFTSMKDFYPDLRKWETEFWIGRGIQTAELIWTAMTNANLNAYLFWSGVWDDSTPNKFESADLIEVNSKGEWRTSANYYALRHYSEFVRPGYVRINMTTDDSNVKVSAYTNEYKNKVAAVLVNTSDNEVLYRINGNGYTIIDSTAYQSVFGDLCPDDSTMYKNIGSLKDGGILTLPAKSVTTVDITGYYGASAPVVPKVTPIVYEPGVLEQPAPVEVPTEDTVILDLDFDDQADLTSLKGFGSSILRLVNEEGGDGKTGYAIVKGRSDAWNGGLLPGALFENYGYLVKVEYDCMMPVDGYTLSLTSNFTIDSTAYYPDGENNRAAVYNVEANKWYHVEGYLSMYTNMKKESFQAYWESPDNTSDFYIDNVKVTILYTQPVGDYVPAE